MLKSVLFIQILFLMITTSVSAQWSSGRPDGHAPIGIMGDHTHGEGEVMFSYRYMVMSMDGNRDGTTSLSNQDVLESYMVTPVEMQMTMHMLGAMYAISDNLTLMGMVNIVQNEMDHLTRMGGAFTTSSQSLGDVALTGLVSLARFGNQRVHAHLGVSLPTGDIESKDVTPASSPNETILPYPMQTGSGTVDFLPGVTYLGQSGNYSWGSQIRSTLRLNNNSNDYRLGNRLLVNSWLGSQVTEWLAPVIKLELTSWGDISGADERLNPAMIHTADPEKKGGTRLDAGIGLNILVPNGVFQDLRFGAEYNIPVVQHLNGPQMETGYILMFGLQYTM